MFGVTLYLTTIASAAVCFAIGATIPVFSVANLLSSFTFIVMMVSTTASQSRHDRLLVAKNVTLTWIDFIVRMLSEHSFIIRHCVSQLSNIILCFTSKLVNPHLDVTQI